MGPEVIQEIGVTLVVFGGMVLIIRAIVDGIVRFRALSSNADAGEVLRALNPKPIQSEHTALKWGLSLGCLGIGFLIIDGLGLQPDQPSTWGVIALSVAAGLLSFYGMLRKLKL